MSVHLDRRLLILEQLISETNKRIDKLFYFIMATLASSIGSLIAVIVGILLRK